MNKFENEVLLFANSFLKKKTAEFLKYEIEVKELPKIDSFNNGYTEFSLTLWSKKKADILVVEFPLYLSNKPFCSIDTAKDWIINDIEEFLKY